MCYPECGKKFLMLHLKPLASWFKDMVERVSFLRAWLMEKAPYSYWMSGFYFPQGFLTGVFKLTLDNIKYLLIL
jgi:dynein heavy chain